MTDSWQHINASSHPGEITLRRADPDHPLDLFRGKDFQGHLLFCFQGALGSGKSTGLPRLAGIDVLLCRLQQGGHQLILKLLDDGDEDIFRALCANLMQVTRDLSRQDAAAGIQIVLTRLRRWQELLKSRRENVLGRNQIVGLVGELLILRDKFLKFTPPGVAVSAWRGPYGDEQDFMIGSWLLEVKTQLSSADHTLRISSENQLDSCSDNIILCHQTLGISSEDDHTARTLNALVEEIILTLNDRDISAIDLFQGALIEIGYIKKPEYDAERWALNDRFFLDVRDDFPRIVPSMLPLGISDVGYCVALNRCQTFRISETEVDKKVFGRDERA